MRSGRCSALPPGLSYLQPVYPSALLFRGLRAESCWLTRQGTCSSANASPYFGLWQKLLGVLLSSYIPLSIIHSFSYLLGAYHVLGSVVTAGPWAYGQTESLLSRHFYCTMDEADSNSYQQKRFFSEDDASWKEREQGNVI